MYRAGFTAAGGWARMEEPGGKKLHSFVVVIVRWDQHLSTNDCMLAMECQCVNK